jgi:hypothetical protein
MSEFTISETYQGHVIRVDRVGGARPFAVWIDGVMLMGTGRRVRRRLAYSKVLDALQVGRKHVRELLAKEYFVPTPTGLDDCPQLVFRPEEFAAYSKQGKYVIGATYAGTPKPPSLKGSDAGVGLREKTEFHVYFFAGKSCEVLRSPKTHSYPETLEEAIQVCLVHARDLERNGQPSGVEA